VNKDIDKVAIPSLEDDAADSDDDEDKDEEAADDDKDADEDEDEEPAPKPAKKPHHEHKHAQEAKPSEVDDLRKLIKEDLSDEPQLAAGKVDEAKITDEVREIVHTEVK
jgi:hypothetical protein